VEGGVVSNILLGKLRKLYDGNGNKKTSKNKDPRPSAAMTTNEIKSNGVRVI
jgi:hypothetical protein